MKNRPTDTGKLVRAPVWGMTSEAEVPQLHAADVLDKDVFDLHGERLGHVSLAREWEGHLVSFDVTLAERAKRSHAAREPIATLMADDVVSTDFVVSMDEDAEHLLHGGLREPNAE